MLGTSEDVIVVANEVVERDRAEERGGAERDVGRQRKVALLLEIVGRRRPGRPVRLKLGQLAQPVRVALTGGSVSPGIYEVIAVLGRDRTVTRLSHAIELISRPS